MPSLPRLPVVLVSSLLCIVFACSDDHTNPEADAALRDTSDTPDADVVMADTSDASDTVDVEDTPDARDAADAVNTDIVDTTDADAVSDVRDVSDEPDVCQPATCQSLGATACGEVDDGCGSTIMCGRCPAGSPNATCPSDHWCWESPAPSGNKFRDLFVLDSSEWYAVGLAGAVLRRKNGVYEHMQTPTDSELQAVWAGASDDVWIASADGEVLHYDGADWQVVYQEPQENHGRFKSIVGLPNGHIWVASYGYAVHHFDGQQWTKYTHGYEYVDQLWASSSTDVWLAGEAMLHFDGTSWSRFSMPDGTDLGFSDIWGFPNGEKFVVGDTIWHFDGSAWNEISSSESGFRHVWGPSPTDIYISHHWDQNRHWDGQNLTALSVDSHLMPNGFHGTGSDDVWGTAGNAFFYFDGTDWHMDYEESTHDIEEAWGPNDAEFWGIPYGQNQPVSSIYRWNAGTYSSVPLEDSILPDAIWGTSASNVYLVGAYRSSSFGGVIHKWDGTSWTTLPRENDWGWLYDVHGSGPNDIWAVGRWGTILHGDGTTFTKTTAPAGDRLTAVWALAPDDVWVGGDNVLLHYDGTGWTEVMPQTFVGDIRAIWGAAPDDVWAASYGGISDPLFIWHYDGQSWTRMSVTGEGSINDIWGRSADDVWFVGSVHNTFFHWDGNALNPVETGTSEYFTAVWGTSTDGPWVFNFHGPRMKYRP